MSIQISGISEVTPQVVTTTAYANDSVQFNLDPRFAAASVLTQVSGAIYYTRGPDSFVEMDLNSTTQKFYAINLYSPIYTSSSIAQFVNKNFTELGI